MMINPHFHTDIAAEIANGDAIKLLDVARQFDVNPSTVLRWLMRGLPSRNEHRVRLEGVRRGKVWLTSRAALQRFLSALPQSTLFTNSSPARSPSARERESARAQTKLKDKYGI